MVGLTSVSTVRSAPPPFPGLQERVLPRRMVERHLILGHIEGCWLQQVHQVWPAPMLHHHLGPIGDRDPPFSVAKGAEEG